jgi:metal-responsive CopG/Arc/MetJ family transcriptional regulator
MPERVLSQLDDYASQHGETRSGLITQATLKFIAEQTEHYKAGT